MSASRRPPRWLGEDTRPTTSKELWGWYAYGLAAEVFAVCGVGSFVPITVEQLAREHGVLRSDGKTPCLEALTTGGAAGASPTRALSQDENSIQCIISPFGYGLNTSSFALYTSALAVLVQTLTLISVSAVADYGLNRKKLLLGLGWTGATTSMLFLVVSPKIYLAAPILVIISVACLGSSFVLLNSFLPLLVANHPTILNQDLSGDLTSEHSDDSDDEDSTHSIPTARASELKLPKAVALVSPELKLANQISSKGVGIGYIASVFMQLVSILVLVMSSRMFPYLKNTTMPMRIVIFFVGMWWALFTIPSALWLRPRPGPPLPDHVSSARRGLGWLVYISFAWKALWKTIKLAARLRQVVTFLIAWFLLSDAIATVSGTAILFAKTELKMDTPSIAAISVVATTSGIGGAFLWPVVGRKLGLETNHIIIACIALFEIVPLYGLVGFLPVFRDMRVGGMQQPWEIYPIAAIHGVVMGGLSSHCRSFYGLLIPPGSEAAFYALYAVTDKGSSVIGPTIVGHIVDATGSIRQSFWFLAVLIVLPAPLIWFVDVKKGRMDALDMAKQLDVWEAVPGHDIDELELVDSEDGAGFVHRG